MEEEKQNIQNNSDSVVNTIANSEARDENAEKIQGATQGSADFTQMFGVQSEETEEQKQMQKQVVEIPRVLEKKEEVVQEVVLSKEEKAANHKKNFNTDEKLLYQIEPEKLGNPIVVVLFFLALVGVIIALPKISKKYDFSTFFKTNPKKQEEVEEDSGYIRLESAATRGKIGNLELINFVRTTEHNDNLLTFTLQNVGDKIYQFDKKYYIVFYESDDPEKASPMYYALIHSFNGVASKAATDLSLVISKRAKEKAGFIKLEEIPEAKYPNVSLSETEGEFEVLTCTYNYDEMKYYLINGKLVKIKEKYLEPNTDAYFNDDLVKFKDLTYKYKSINNFSSTIIEDSNSFTQLNEILLEKISDNEITSLKTYRFFRYNTDKNTIAFELESQGYACR